MAAEERGAYYISFGSDMSRFVPNVFLTGTLWNWALIMTDIVEAVCQGMLSQYPGQDWWYGLAEGGVKLAPLSLSQHYRKIASFRLRRGNNVRLQS
jgi:basic membrane protein A